MSGLDKFHPLKPAEEQLLDECGSGDWIIIGQQTLPETYDPAREIRGPVLRYFCLGGGSDAPVHEKGVHLVGAWISGTLDLSGARVERDLVIVWCKFDEPIHLHNATTGQLTFSGSHAPGIFAGNLNTNGSLLLRSGFTSDGVVRLGGANIGASFECDGSTFLGASGMAIIADHLTVNGSVYFRSGFRAEGSVRLVGAKMRGGLDCRNGAFVSPNDYALILAGAEIGGDVFAKRGFRADGEVNLKRAKIDGDLDLSFGEFINENDTAIAAEDVQISGALKLRNIKALNGRLNLTHARIGSIFDEEASWPDSGELILNGCVYGSFTGEEVPIDATTRIKWLALQDPARWKAEFWPQPYEQLAKVYRDMGNGEDARRVLITKEREQRKAARRRLGERLQRAKLRLSNPNWRILEHSEKELLEIKRANELRSDGAEDVSGSQTERVTALFNEAVTVVERKFAAQKKARDRLKAIGTPVLASQAERDSIYREEVTWLTAELWLRTFADALLSATIAYGYRPARAFIWLFILVGLGAVIFARAWGVGAMIPNSAVVLRSPEWIEAASIAPDHPAAHYLKHEVKEYPPFQSLAYSFDTFLPIVDLHQESHWMPDATRPFGGFARIYLWLHIGAGWLLTALAVAGFTGLVKKE